MRVTTFLSQMKSPNLSPLRMLDHLLSPRSQIMCVLTHEGTCQHAGRGWSCLTGWDKADVVGRWLGELCHEEDRLAITRSVECAAAYRQECLTARSAFRLLRPDGRWQWFEGSFMPLGTEAVLLLLKDISAQKEMEQQLEVALRAEKLSRKRKADFLRHMSHELRTPLNAVIGFSELMMNEMLGPVDNPTYMSYLRHIHFSGQELLAQIDQAFEIASTEEDAIVLNEQVVDLKEAVNVALRQVDELAFRRFAIHWGQAGPLWVRIDSKRYRHAISLILQYALRLMEAEAALDIAIRRTPKGNIRISFAIPCERSRLSEEECSAGARRFLNPGEDNQLSLLLAQKVVEAHGGRFARAVYAKAQRISITIPATRCVTIEKTMPFPKSVAVAADRIEAVG